MYFRESVFADERVVRFGMRIICYDALPARKELIVYDNKEFDYLVVKEYFVVVNRIPEFRVISYPDIKA